MLRTRWLELLETSADGAGHRESTLPSVNTPSRASTPGRGLHSIHDRCELVWRVRHSSTTSADPHESIRVEDRVGPPIDNDRFRKGEHRQEKSNWLMVPYSDLSQVGREPSCLPRLPSLCRTIGVVSEVGPVDALCKFRSPPVGA